MFQASDPTMGTSLSGATLPVAQAFTTRRQAGGHQGDRAPVSPEAAVILCCLGLAGGHGNTSRTSSPHTPAGPPSLAWELLAAGDHDELQKSGALSERPISKLRRSHGGAPPQSI